MAFTKHIQGYPNASYISVDKAEQYQLQTVKGISFQGARKKGPKVWA